CRLAYDGRALAFIGPLALATFLLPRVAAPTVFTWLVACGLIVLGWSLRIRAQIHLGYRLPVRVTLTRAWQGQACRTYCHRVARWLPRRGASEEDCSHWLSSRLLLAEVQGPVVLVPAGVETFGLTILAAGSTLARIRTQGRGWLL